MLKQLGLFGAGEAAELAPLDAAAARWQVQAGDVWEVPSKRMSGISHRVVCGDATNADVYAAACAGQIPWMMVTDPPYGVTYDPGWRDTELHIPMGDALNKMTGTVANDDRAGWEAAYALFGGDVAYVWHASSFIAQVQQDLKAVGFDTRSLIIWVKPNFAISRGDYHWQHEPCWYAVRKGQPARRNDDRTQSTVWQIAWLGAVGRSRDANDAATGHGTQKPLECMQRPIRNHVFPPGTCVYDPFLGSGTTLIAAEMEGRICCGCELSPGYVAVVLERAWRAGLKPRRV